jgi:hypothetical protein
MKRERLPPPVISGLYVLEHAHADKSVRFEQRHWLNVGGKWLGRAPYLAICQGFDDRTFCAQFCSSQWQSLGIAADYKSIKELKDKIERSYHGITPLWKRQPVPRAKARSEYETQVAAESCSFCARPIFMVTAMIETKNGVSRICNHCVDHYHEVLHPERPGT